MCCFFWFCFVHCFLEKQLIYQFHLCSHSVSVQFIISVQVYNLALFKLHSIFKELCLQFVKTPSNSYVHQHFCSSCQVSTVSKFCLYTHSFIIQVKALSNIRVRTSPVEMVLNNIKFDQQNKHMLHTRPRNSFRTQCKSQNILRFLVDLLVS